jgi:ribonuclease HI
LTEAQFTVVFDGGSLGNPGRGYGSYRVRQHGGQWEPAVRLEFGSAVTNNEAEYRALLAALADVAARAADPRQVSLEVLGDSLLVLNQLRGAWRVRADNLRPLYAQARSALDRFGAVRLTWQRRNASVALLGH